MQIADVQQIGEDLAVKWSDGSETFVKLETLRRACPCAACKGEMDIMGNLYKAASKPLSARSFQLSRISLVGGYAMQPFWADGHSSGLFTYEYLRGLAK